MTISDITVQSARLAAAETQYCSTDFGYLITAVEPWREDGAKLVRFVQAERNGQSSLLEYSVLFAPDSARVICCRVFDFTEALAEDDDWVPMFSAWRKGGWYVWNIARPEGGCGCVSRNYADGKWRIVSDPHRDEPGAPGDFTYATRTEAAKAERALIAEQARALLHKARCNDSSLQLLSVRLVCDKHGYQDFDIEGHPTVHRACVPNGIRVGQQFNVYHGEGMKSGAVWTGTLEGSIRKFACI